MVKGMGLSFCKLSELVTYPDTDWGRCRGKEIMLYITNETNILHRIFSDSFNWKLSSLYTLVLFKHFGT